jgi:hypothetical protein
MMFTVYERNTLTANLILDLEDVFARGRGRPGDHPRPFEPLRFFLIDQDLGGGLILFDPPIELEMIRNPSGFHLFFGRQILRGTRGEIFTRALDLPPGKYTVRVTSTLYQTMQKTIDLPIGNANDPSVISRYHLDLQASFAYPFPDVYSLGQPAANSCSNGTFTPRRGTTLLRGVLLDTGGRGLTGGTVRVASRSNTYTTDVSGQWVLWFSEPQPTGPVDVIIQAPGQTAQQVQDVCVIQGHETSLHQTALRGWVRRGTMPVANAVISVQGMNGQATSDMHGDWTYVFPFSQAVQEVTLIARVQGLPVQTRTVTLVSRSTVIVDPFQI